MKLSIVIICWNDLKVIKNCLESIFTQSTRKNFEIIISDNGSDDESVVWIKAHHPSVRIVENGKNLGFANGNNAGIAVAQGDYVLILNPDTIIHDHALDKLVAFADQHPEGGAFGCRVLNRDGSFQNPARPLPTTGRALVAALYLRSFGCVSKKFIADVYLGWDGRTVREIGFQSGCCVLLRGPLLAKLRGFDSRFFYHKEEVDLCKRVWDSGKKILFCPDAEITHLGGQSVGRFPTRFALETCRSRYRYFFKHFGCKGARQIRWIWLLHVLVRYVGYRLRNIVKRDETILGRLEMYRTVLRWNWQIDPLKFNLTGEEPDLSYAPMAPAPKLSEAEEALLLPHV